MIINLREVSSTDVTPTLGSLLYPSPKHNEFSSSWSHGDVRYPPFLSTESNPNAK